MNNYEKTKQTRELKEMHLELVSFIVDKYSRLDKKIADSVLKTLIETINTLNKEL